MTGSANFPQSVGLVRPAVDCRSLAFGLNQHLGLTGLPVVLDRRSRLIHIIDLKSNEFVFVPASADRVMGSMGFRVAVTPSASALICVLRARHGRLAFLQRRQLWSRPSPLCMRLSELRIEADDLHLGDADGCPFIMAAAEFELWQDVQLILDVIDGGNASDVLEAEEGARFLSRPRLFSKQELTDLAAWGPPAPASAALKPRTEEEPAA